MKITNQKTQNLIKINLINHRLYKNNLTKSKNKIFEILKIIFGTKNNCIFLRIGYIKKNFKKAFKIIFSYILLKFKIYFINLSQNFTHYLKIKPTINLLILKNIYFKKHISHKMPTISFNNEFKNAVYNIIGNFKNKRILTIFIFNIFYKIIKLKLLRKKKESIVNQRKYFFQNKKWSYLKKN